MQHSPRPPAWLLPLLPALVTLAVCLYKLDGREAWRDEHATWWVTRLDRQAFWHLMSNIDAVLAPYYLLQRGWVRLVGGSLAALRLPSSLALSACAGLLTALGMRLSNARAGVFAGLLFAALPSVSRYGQEARPYAFAMLACTASLWLLLRALDHPERAPRWLAYALGVVALGGFHLVALSSLVAHPIALFERSQQPLRVVLRRAAAWRWLISVVVALALLAPLTWLGHAQSAQVAWTKTEAARLLQLPTMIFHTRLMGSVVLCLGLAAIHARAAPRPLLAGWALGPTLLLYFSHPVLHFFIHRYMLFTLPAWCLLAALTLDDLARGVVQLAKPRARAAATVTWLLPALVLVLVALLGLRQQARLRHPTRAGSQHPYAAVARLLRAKLQAGDAIAYGGQGNDPNWSRTAMAYELDGAARPRDVFVARTPADAGRLIAEECAGPHCLPNDVQRLWFMTTDAAHEPFSHLRAERRALFEREFEVAEVMALPKLSLCLLRRRAATE